jgi:hypothetical protein
MKAKLYKFDAGAKIELENGIIFSAKVGTTINELVLEATEFVISEYTDSLTVEETNVRKYKNRSSKELLRAAETKTGIELGLVKEVLITRGLISEPVKNLKKQISDTEIKTKVAEAKKKIGATISFTDKAGKLVTGKIHHLQCDKRTGMIFYMFNETGGRMRGRTIWATDCTITK